MPKAATVGSLWAKTTKSGSPFFSGRIKISDLQKEAQATGQGDEVNIVLWANDKGDNPKRPDYQICVNDWKKPG